MTSIGRQPFDGGNVGHAGCAVAQKRDAQGKYKLWLRTGDVVNLEARRASLELPSGAKLGTT